MNINLFIVISYLFFFPLLSSMLLFIPIIISSVYFKKYNNFIYILKNLYWSSFSLVFQILINPKIYVNFLELFNYITNHPEQQNIIILNQSDFLI